MTCSKFEEDLFLKCFNKWGVVSQLIMLMEESAELIQSTSKDMYRKQDADSKKRFEHFTEELADCQLMIDEFIYFYHLEEDIDYFRMLKCERLQKLLDK